MIKSRTNRTETLEELGRMMERLTRAIRECRLFHERSWRLAPDVFRAIWEGSE